MKSLLRKTLVFVLFCTVHFAVNAQSVGTVVGNGSCGTSVQYQLIVNSNYMNDPNSYTGLTLRIYGKGAMTDYAAKTTPWYDKRLSITKVIVEEGVTSVGKYMCYGHSNLLDAHLPSTLTKIGTWAFYSCDKMTVINIPENVTTIESNVFSGTNFLNVIFESTNPSGLTIPTNNFIPSGSGYKMYIPSGTKSSYQGKSSTLFADANVIEGTPYFCTFAVPEGLCDLPYQYALFYENKVRTLALPVRKSDGTTTTWDIEVIPQPGNSDYDYARYGYQQPNEFAFMADGEGHKYTDADGDNKLHINVSKNTELEPHFNFTVGPVQHTYIQKADTFVFPGYDTIFIPLDTICSAATLVSNVEASLHYNKLIHKIFGGESSGEFYFDNFTSAISFDTMVVENVIDGSKWYYFSYPFDCEWDDLKVTSVDGSIDYSSVYPETERYDSPYRWIILGFDPVKFASGLQGMDAYTFVESGTTLKKGIVYAVGVIGSSTDSLKFAGASTDFHSIKKQQDLEVSLTYAESTLENLITEDWDSSAPLLSRAGWNLVSFPFPMNVTTSHGADNVYTYALHMDFGRYFYSISTWANDEEYGSGNEVWFEYPDEDEDGVFFERQGPGMMLFAQVDENETSGNFTSVWTKQTRAAAPKAKSEIIEISIAQDTNVYDKVYISNKETASSAYVIKEDCYKMENAGKAQIYTFTTDTAPCVFNEQNLAEGRKVIPFGMNIPKAGNYTFSLNTDRYMGPLAVLNLHDLSNDSRINLMNGPVDLSLGAGRSNNRYELEIEYLPAAILPVENTGSAVAYTTDDMLHVENIAEGSMVSVYDASGRMVMTESGSERIDCQLPSRGVYMVVVRGEENSTIKVVY